MKGKVLLVEEMMSEDYCSDVYNFNKILGSLVASV